MRNVQVSSKTYRDNTGRSIDFPTLLVEYNGETMLFEQLHRYQIKNRSKSRTWHKKLVQALDSGEMDTYKYVQSMRNVAGEWIKNDSHLSQGTERNPFERGVLRKFKDKTTQLKMTGFFYQHE